MNMGGPRQHGLHVILFLQYDVGCMKALCRVIFRALFVDRNGARWCFVALRPFTAASASPQPRPRIGLLRPSNAGIQLIIVEQMTYVNQWSTETFDPSFWIGGIRRADNEPCACTMSYYSSAWFTIGGRRS